MKELGVAPAIHPARHALDRVPEPRPARGWHTLVMEVGDTLARIALEAQDLLLGAQDPALIEEIQVIRQQAASSLEDLSRARTAIDRASLRATGLLTDLRRLARRFSLASGIHADLRLPRRPLDLSEEVSWAVHTAVDEALDGLALRSRATGLVLTLASVKDVIRVTMRDDGVSLMTRQAAGWRASPLTAIRAIVGAVEEVGGFARLAPLRPRGLILRAEIPV